MRLLYITRSIASPSYAHSPMTSSPHHNHNVVILPFLAQGHMLPLLDLSKSLSHRGLTITIITTPSNIPTISKHIQTQPSINIKQIPFPQVEDLPNGCENTSQVPSGLLGSFLAATLQLQRPFEDALQEMAESGSLPVCVISDYFLSWSVVGCRIWNIPRFVFMGNGVIPMAITKSIFLNFSDLPFGLDTDPVHIPGVNLPFSLTLMDFTRLKHANAMDPFRQFYIQIDEWDKESSGIIVNSFMELEREHVSALESFYKEGCKAWCIGPFLLHPSSCKSAKPSEPYIKWLDEKTCKSVIYVSYGSQPDISDAQLDEIAYGLEMSGHPFIWAEKSKMWILPKGMEERIVGRGLIVRDWVDQRSLLSHPAIGGFLSHCGWNSVMESLCAGVPLLAWPLSADQPWNAKFVVDGLGVGLSVPMKRREAIPVYRETICKVVKELMELEAGERARQNMQVLAGLARNAVQKGGSSDKNLTELIHCLCRQEV